MVNSVSQHHLRELSQSILFGIHVHCTYIINKYPWQALIIIIIIIILFIYQCFYCFSNWSKGFVGDAKKIFIVVAHAEPQSFSHAMVAVMKVG